MSRTLFHINHSKILYDPPPRVMERKINKRDLIKLKSSCSVKETINKVKRQPSEWQKIIANETTDKGLISKIYKQLMQLHTRKTNNPIKKWAEDIFPKKTYRLKDTQFHMKRYSISFIIRETQNKTTMRFTSHWSEWPSSKNLPTINAGEDVEKREPSCAAGGNVN